MSPERVSVANEVSINAARFPTVGPVQSIPASAYPQKFVLGDFNEETHERLSVISWNDFRGGQGLFTTDGRASERNRYWAGLIDSRHKRAVTLAPLPFTTANPGGAIVSNAVLIDRANVIFLMHHSGTAEATFQYDNGADSWGNSVHTQPSTPISAANVYLNGTEWIVVACSGNYSRYDGTTWENETDDASYFTQWDDRVWKITSAGQLSYTLDLSVATPVWTNDALLSPKRNTAPRSLFVGPLPSGEPAIYASTDGGLWVHDANNARFLETGLQFTVQIEGGQYAQTWRSRIYVPVGKTVYEYTPGTPAIVRAMGPGQDDGVATAINFHIEAMVGTHNDLIVSGDSGVNSINSDAPILAWDTLGWTQIWQHATQDQDVLTMLASDAYGSHRLWWVAWESDNSKRVYYLPLEVGLRNPTQVTTDTFTNSSDSQIILPWFDAGQTDVTKLAVRLKVEVRDASADETIIPRYATDFGSVTTLATITSDGITTYDLPNSTTPTGVAFREIQLDFQFARGATNTNAPKLMSVSLEYRKKLDRKEGYRVTLDLNNDYGGRSVIELREALQTAKESDTKVEFVFRDDDDNSQNYYVDIQDEGGTAETGHDERGLETILLFEV